MDLTTLKPGDWVRMDFAGRRDLFCLFETEGDDLVLGKPNWLTRDALVETPASFMARSPKLVGAGKPRPWRRFLPRFIRELVFPYKPISY